MEFNNEDEEYEIEEIEEEEPVGDDGEDLQADVDELLETYATSRRRRTTRRVRSKKGNFEKFMNEHKRRQNIISNNKDEKQNLGPEINDKKSESSNKRLRKVSDDFDLNKESNKLGYGNKIANRPRFIKIIDYDDFRFKIYVSTDYKSKSNGEKNEEEMKKYAPCKEIDITLYATYEREKNDYQGNLIKGKIYSTLLKSNKNTFKKYKGLDKKKYRSYVNKYNDMVKTNKSSNYTIKKKNI